MCFDLTESKLAVWHSLIDLLRLFWFICARNNHTTSVTSLFLFHKNILVIAVRIHIFHDFLILQSSYFCETSAFRVSGVSFDQMYYTIGWLA